MKNRKIKVFYTPKQVCQKDIQEKSTSQSPLKPILLMQHLKDNGFENHLSFTDDFEPFNKADFRLAHTKEYVDNFFSGTGNCQSNALPWSPELADSVRYTNSSLYHAIKYAVENPETITFSPTSGFHHAGPNAGQGFCTFSGQVIAATRMYREDGKVAAFLDLDGHFGNSIPDSEGFVKDLKQSIAYNINPKSIGREYVDDLKHWLKLLEASFVAGDVDYVVWCHGADSHIDDDLGHQCTTSEWIECSKIFYTWVKYMELTYGIVVPVTLALFGGYRRDDYNSVLSLHASDLRECINILCGGELQYETTVKAKHRTLSNWNWNSGSRSTRRMSRKVRKNGVSRKIKRLIRCDSWELRELTAEEIIDFIKEMTGQLITTPLKDKKRIIRNAYQLLTDYDYV